MRRRDQLMSAIAVVLTACGGPVASREIAAPMEVRSSAPPAAPSPPRVVPDHVPRVDLPPKPTIEPPPPRLPCPSSVPEEHSECLPPPGPTYCGYGELRGTRTNCTCVDMEWAWTCVVYRSL